MSYFESIRLHKWRQFQEIDIDLSSRVTILTGANGSGKTTILTLLSRHLDGRYLLHHLLTLANVPQNAYIETFARRIIPYPTTNLADKL